MMQTFWPRAQIQAYTCRCGSCLKSSASNAASNRTVSAASRRRMLIGNSVTGFYATLFATAVAWDTSVKTRRRIERQQEIEAVKAEVEALELDQLRRLEALASRKRTRTSTTSQQRRKFSTSTRPDTLQRRCRELSTQAVGAQYRNSETEALDVGYVNPGVEDPATPRIQPHPRELTNYDLDVDPRSEAEIERYESDLSLNDILRQRAILRLAARQLAIKMILRPALAHLYAGVPFTSRASCILPDIEIEKLLEELEDIRVRIAKLRGSRDAWFGDLARNITIVEHENLVAERAALNEDLKRMYTMYQDDELTSRDLLVKVAENILSSEEPLSRLSVSLMIRMFGRSRQNDVVNMIIDSIFPNGLILGEGVIIATLDFFNKSKDLYRFDGFLNRLLGGKLLRLPQYWKLTKVGNIEIPVPPRGSDHAILSTLISSALGFNQPERADAWLAVMRHRGYADNPYILGSYLRFYSQQQDWEKGGLLLLRVVDYISSAVADNEGQFERLILYMAAFCNSCGKDRLGSSILKAAAGHGIDWQDAYNSTDERIVILSTLERWRAAAGLPKLPVSHLSMDERHRAFANSVRGSIQQAVSITQGRKVSYQRRYDQLAYKIRSSELVIRDLKFEMDKESHRRNMRNLHLKLSQPSETEFIRDEVHSLDIAIRDIALEIERQTRKAEMATLKSQLDMIQAMLPHKPLQSDTPSLETSITPKFTNPKPHSAVSPTTIELQNLPTKVSPRIKRISTINKYPSSSTHKSYQSSPSN
ncbi:hypothetical protein MGYG_03312 [Nannizzia gypsea CBS 118893]|uniref:Uncharacterized protein n=1 Tax=Arthroderma gypseum (strain ATCC MYA-4604 / CBS 118893) TaxID=535722 RepID=E4UMV7_ARTGP|nr:hypothetical protein MGYG_03312 [Nannizzia gypsea CBS 118893]EFR00311.1 hypothetical protein MGYG_03312 [Nannizzia gypsea CBS 118893]